MNLRRLACGPRPVGGRRVLGIGAVTGNAVTDDEVVVEILARRMAMHGNARQAIVLQYIVNYHVAVGLCAGCGIENANSRTGSRDLKPIARRVVIGDGVSKDAQGRH